MGELVILVVVVTSIWVAFDAPAHGESRTWGLGCLLLWLIAFPWYLSVRSRKRRLARAEAPATPPPPPPGPPPGWYPDPTVGQSRQRWWNGQRWTEHERH